MIEKILTDEHEYSKVGYVDSQHGRTTYGVYIDLKTLEIVRSEGPYKYSLDVIQENLDLKWDFNRISRKEDLTFEFIDNNINEEWNWGYLSTRIFIEDKCD
jgi:hypothetical protein